MQMHFRKCELVLKPEQAWFASKTVVFGLLHQHVEVSKVHLTFFEWCWHQYVGERTWDTSWWWMALSLLIYCPHPVLLHVFPSINDAPSPTWPKRKPWVSSCTSLSSVLTPKPCCSYPSIFSYLSASFGQGTDISCLDDCIGFLTGFLHSICDTSTLINECLYPSHVSSCHLTIYLLGRGWGGQHFISLSIPPQPAFHSPPWDRVHFAAASYGLTESSWGHALKIPSLARGLGDSI